MSLFYCQRYAASLGACTAQCENCKSACTVSETEPPSAEYRVLHAQFVEMRERWQKRDAYARSLEARMESASAIGTMLEPDEAWIQRYLSQTARPDTPYNRKCTVAEITATLLTAPAATVPEERDSLLRALCEQIEKCNPVDDHDHDFKMNKAYCDAVAFLKGE